MLELQNGCTKTKTLDLMNMFYDNVHCGSWMMSPCECGDETVYIDFTLSGERYSVKFSVDKWLGELFIEYGGDIGYDYCGDVTPEKLRDYLDSIPHIFNVLE